MNIKLIIKYCFCLWQWCDFVFQIKKGHLLDTGKIKHYDKITCGIYCKACGEVSAWQFLKNDEGGKQQQNEGINEGKAGKGRKKWKEGCHCRDRWGGTVKQYGVRRSGRHRRHF